MTRKKIIYLIIFAVIAVAAAVGIIYNRKGSGPEYVTEPVHFGTLTQTVEATGKVESAERIELNFKTTGRVSRMLANVGGHVSRGQLLAQLESQALSSQVDDARARLANEEAQLEKLLAGSSEEDVKVAEDTVTQKEESLKSAENTLSTLLKKQDIELENLKDTALTVVLNEMTIASGAVEKIDDTLTDEDAKPTLGVKNGALMPAAEKKKTTADSDVNAIESYASQLNGSSSDEDVRKALDDARSAIQSVKTALSATIDVLLGTVVTSSFTETQLDTLTTNIQAKQTLMNASLSNIQTAKSNWTNGIASYADNVVSAQDAVDSARAALSVAESQLALKKAPPRTFDISAQEASVSQADAALALAHAKLEEATIRAPISGTITKRFVELGEQTSFSQNIFEMIGDAMLEIEVDIPESDISKVILGQEAGITLDAFGDDEKFTGTVTFVDPAETLIQDVVYYRVKVSLEDEFERARPGMTANVTIVTATKGSALWVPFRSVKSHNGTRYVEIVDAQGLVEERDVTLGVRGDEGIEITDGLSEGEQVITFTKE